MANYVANKIVCTEEILNEYVIDYYPIEDDRKVAEPYISFNKLLEVKTINEYSKKYGECIYYGYGFSYEKNKEGLVEIKFFTKWLYPICAIVKAVEMFRGNLTWYASEECNVYLSKFFWDGKDVKEDTLYLENTEFEKWREDNEDYLETIESPDYDVWHYDYTNRSDWKVWESEDLIKRYFDEYPLKEYYNEIQKEKIMDMDELEEVLYNGSKAKIEEVLSEYKIAYEFCEEFSSFSFKSFLLNEVCRGYQGCSVPNCVKYFGVKFTYNSNVSI